MSSARRASSRHRPAPSQEVRAVLRTRARELAARRLEAKARDVLAEVVVFRRASVAFAVSLEKAQEVRVVEAVRLPGAGGVVAGMFHIRGRTHGLIDLGSFFEDCEPLDHGARTLVLVLRGCRGELGVRIDEVIGARTLFAEEVDDGLVDRELGFVSHVTRDRVQVLDVEALMAVPEVRIKE